jgi:hypothetical protein
MANPAIIECPAGEWTKVAADTVSGKIYILNHSPNVYLHTYRTAEDSAPTGIAEGVKMQAVELISAVAGIDVYVWAVGVPGTVRVDLP